MVIIDDALNAHITEDTVLAIGKFDGVHLGHKLILDTMAEYRAMGMKMCVVTFTNPPASLGFGKNTDVIYDLDEKRQVFSRYGVDFLIEFPFNKETAAISAKDFLDEYIVSRYNAKAIVVGSDCTFGYKAQGNAKMLVDYGPIYGYEIKVLNKLYDEETEISSTYVRELISKGSIKKANQLMYRPYFINGIFDRALSGETEGLLIYTMNICNDKILPPNGFYIAKVMYDEALYPGISYVNCEDKSLQIYIYGSVKGIASKEVSVVLFERIESDSCVSGLLDDKSELREMIFECEKWHKENPIS